ncbi:hypothetical protein ACSLOI_28280, partial [Escherichia coli]|uniref:hypothetical protein n=1 Tax=Escherichia coli TaxID=562 RepID=UPI003EE3BAFC
AASQTASANSATAAKKSETSAKNSETATKASEKNAKSSQTAAAVKHICTALLSGLRILWQHLHLLLLPSGLLPMLSPSSPPL